MAETGNDIQATFPIPPPVGKLPIVDGRGYLTPSGLIVLQLIWAAIQGNGGLLDLAYLDLPNAGVGLAEAQAVLDNAMGGMMGLFSSSGQLAALEGKAQQAEDLARLALGRSAPSSGGASAAVGAPFGYEVSVFDIAARAGQTIRLSISVPWTFPATTSNPAGFVTGKVATGPAADTDFDIQKDGVSVGTARWAGGGTTAALIKAADTVLAINDYVDVLIPATLHGMAGAWGLALMGVRT